MSSIQYLKGAVVALATLGMIVPSPKLFAADQKTQPQQKITLTPSTKNPKTSQIPDVSLAEGGVFSGRVVDHSGTPLEGAEVVIKQNNKELTRVVTDKNGLFTSANMKGGIYQVSSGNTDGVFRLWTEKTAPPVAKGQALLVMGENGARGQFGAVDPALLLIVAGIIATLVITGITLDKVNRIENDENKSN